MKSNITPVFSLAVFESIRKTIGTFPPESGGMLCGNRKTGAITYFHYDELAERSPATYVPDRNTLNKLLTRLNAEGLDMIGFVHSHPREFTMPTGGDMFYCSKIFAANPALPFFVIPIVDPIATDRQFSMRVYIATQMGEKIEIVRVPLHVVEMEIIDSEIDLPETAATEIVS